MFEKIATSPIRKFWDVHRFSGNPLAYGGSGCVGRIDAQGGRKKENIKCSSKRNTCFKWPPPWHFIWHSLVASCLPYVLICCLASHLAFQLAIFFLAHILAFFLACYLAFLLTIFLAFYLAFFLAFYRAFFLAFYLAYLLTFCLAQLQNAAPLKKVREWCFFPPQRWYWNITDMRYKAWCSSVAIIFCIQHQHLWEKNWNDIM